MKKIEAYESAYPGSMFEREDGGFIRRDDAESLAGSLLALIKSGDRATEDANDEIKSLRAENQRLKDALFFWLPNIPAAENECTDRMANDAALLIGHECRIDDSAEQRGWILLTPNVAVEGAEPLAAKAPSRTKGSTT